MMQVLSKLIIFFFLLVGLSHASQLLAEDAPKKSADKKTTSKETTSTKTKPVSKNAEASPKIKPVFSPTGQMGKLSEIRERVRRAIDRNSSFKDDVVWRKYDKELESFLAEEDSKTAAYAEALFLLARINDRRHFATKELSYAKKAATLYRKLNSTHSKFYQTDDALYFLGKLETHVFKNDSHANNYFHQILKRFPGSNRSAEVRKIIGLPEQTFAAWDNKDKKSDNFLGSDYSVIVIDPGHGGIESGAVGVDKAQEKELVLIISKKVKEILESKLKIRTLLTREGDDRVPLKRRTEIANENEAALFISIHANSSEKGLYQGVETYYLDNTNNKSSLKLAQKENKQISSSGSNQDLQFILSDLIQSAKLQDSISLAHLVQGELISDIKNKYGYVRNLGVKKAPFHVLVGAYMPCILIEVAFIDHPEEGKRLLTKEYQDLVAKSISTGIEKYLQKQVNVKE